MLKRVVAIFSQTLELTLFYLISQAFTKKEIPTYMLEKSNEIPLQTLILHLKSIIPESPDLTIRHGRNSRTERTPHPNKNT